MPTTKKDQEAMDERHAEQSAGGPQPDVAQPDVPQPDIAAPKPTSPARRNDAAPWLLLVVVLLVVGVATSPWWAPSLAGILPWGGTPSVVDRDAPEQIATLTGRLGTLEQRVAAPAPATLPPDALAKTDEQLAALDHRLDAIEQQLTQQGQGGAAGADLGALRQTMERAATAQAQLGERITALEKQKPEVDLKAFAALQDTVARLGSDLAALGQRLDKLATAAADDGRTDEALVLALGQLREAMAGSAPFVDALDAASALTRSRPEVKTVLAPLAEPAARGIPSLALLRQHFERVAGEIANANETPAAGWGPWVGEKLRSLFAARRVGTGAVGDSPEAVVATAEGALQAGDLAGAVTVLGGLRGAAAATAKPWLDDAQRRLAAEAALDKASGLVTARLAQGPTAPGTGTDSAGKQP